MNKAKSFIKKTFSSKNKKSIISIVALIQCVILIVLTAYSWIESISSLVIKGNDLPIAENINYRFDIDAEAGLVDLSTYFRPTALYQMAHASSPDGDKFYFKKDNATTYRLGDTTDYNTSYYNFDFQIHNETAKSYNYYFEKSDIFKVTADGVDASVLNTAAGAFRIAVTTGAITRVYSRDEVSYKPVNNVSGAVTTNDYTSTGLSGDSPYVYSDNVNDDNFVFSTTGGGEDARVTVKIWFEEKDAGYLGLTPVQKKALDGAIVNINLKFVNDASDFDTFFFDDYTFSTVNGYLGRHVTEQSASQQLYLNYYDGDTEEETVIPFVTTKSDNEATRWVTASDDGVASPRISKDMIKSIKQNPDKQYFYYGTKDKKTITYKWPITTPEVNEGNTYVFKAMSVHKFNGVNTGYGVWDTKNTPIKLWYFKDQTSSATSEAYNTNGYQIFAKAGQNRLYLGNSTAASSNVTRMYYDESKDVFKGYFLENPANPVFSFNIDDNFKDTNIKVQWNASNPTEYNGETVYRALGYKGTGLVSSQSKAQGVGTWGLTEQILFSTELVDASINPNYRYKISAIVNGDRCEYYMTKHNSTLTWGAFVPKDTGNTANDSIQFKYCNSVTGSAATTWNSADTVRVLSNKFYATDMNSSTANGQWHIGVVVDGTTDNVVSDVLSNVPGSKLEYSVNDGTSYEPMKELGNNRWYTGDFHGNLKKIKYRWTAYPEGENVNTAVFDYEHNLADGIYFNITE